MTRLSVSVRELLDDDLVEQLTAETMDKPRTRVVLLYRIALAAACVALVAGVTAAGIWMSRQPPKIAGPSAASSVSSAPGTGSTAPSNETGDLYAARLQSLLPPEQKGLPETGRELPVYTLLSLTDEERKARLVEYCTSIGLTPAGEVFTEEALPDLNGESLYDIKVLIEFNDLLVRQLTIDPSGRIHIEFGVLDASYWGTAFTYPAPVDTSLTASLPHVSESLALYYYERLSALYPIEDPVVDSYTTGSVHFEDGEAYAIRQTPHVTIRPAARDELDAIRCAALYGITLEIDPDTGALTGMTLPPPVEEEEVSSVPVITENEAIALWEDGSYVPCGAMYNFTGPDPSRILRVRLEYWQHYQQKQLIPVYTIYMEDTSYTWWPADQCADPFSFSVPAVSSDNADWNDIWSFINDSYECVTWSKE